jgi:hypothetical protein
MRDLNKMYVGKPERNKPLGTPKCIWKDDSKMNLTERVGTSGGLS